MRKIDYRQKENRLDCFNYWSRWSVKQKEVDPPIWLTNYLFERFEHNIEQKLWIAWIYGTTYHLPTTWVIWNEFPDFELVDIDRLKWWNDRHYKRLRYQTDTKYNKGYLPQQFISYKNFISFNNKSGLQQDRFQNLSDRGFNHTFETISKNLYKFGRYSTWFYMQTLHECCKISFDPIDLKLKDFSGSKSHRNGLCYVLGHDDWIDKKLDKSCVLYLEYIAKEILQQNNMYNLYQMETLLCSFKKIFRRNNGRYLGYYLDRQAEEIKKAENDNWSGIDWQVFWDARKEKLHPKLAQSKTIRKNLFNHFLDKGNLEYNTL